MKEKPKSRTKIIKEIKKEFENSKEKLKNIKDEEFMINDYSKKK